MSGDAKQIFDSFKAGWTAAIKPHGKDKYLYGLSCGKQLKAPSKWLCGCMLEGWLVGVNVRWLALTAAASRCGYDATAELHEERQWMIGILSKTAERVLDRDCSFADAREGVTS